MTWLPDSVEDRGSGTNHAAIAITRASSPGDFDAARSLLSRYRRWLEKTVGSDLTNVQPPSLSELADLEHFYEPPSDHLLVAA